MKRVVSFLCIIVSLFLIGCRKDLGSKELDIEEQKIMNSENKEIMVDSENNEESEYIYIIVDDGPQIERGYKLTREDYYEIFGHYPDDYSNCIQMITHIEEEPIKDLLEEKEKMEYKYFIVDDNGPQKSPLIKALIEHGYKLTREEFFEIFGHYPGEYPCGEPIKYDLLEGKDNLKK